MSRRPSSLLDTPPSIGYDASPHIPLTDKLRNALDRMGFLNTLIDTDAEQTQDATPEPQVEYTSASLAKYLDWAGIHIVGYDKDAESNYVCMAAPITTLHELAIPEELTIVQITPDNQLSAKDYRDIALQNSLDAGHCPTPYTKPDPEELKKSYYVGYVTQPGQEPIPATTLQITNFGEKGNVAIVDNVSTLENFRGRNYGGILISQALSGSDYTVAYLDSFKKAQGVYERLGFLPVGE